RCSGLVNQALVGGSWPPWPRGTRAYRMMPPNARVQRTSLIASALRKPLIRRPLGVMAASETLRSPIDRIMPSFVPVLVQRGVPGSRADDQFAVGERRLALPELLVDQQEEYDMPTFTALTGSGFGIGTSILFREDSGARGGGAMDS